MAEDERGAARAPDGALPHEGSLWHMLRARAAAVMPLDAAAGRTKPPRQSFAVEEVARDFLGGGSGGGGGSAAREGRRYSRAGSPPGRSGAGAALSLREVLHESSSLAALLASEGRVGAGDRVAALLPNSLLFVVAHYAVAGAGAIAVDLNTNLTAPELRALLADAGAKVVIADAQFADTLEAVLAPGGLAVDLVLWAPPPPQHTASAGRVAAGEAPTSPTAAPRAGGGGGGVGGVALAGLRQRRLVFDSTANELVDDEPPGTNVDDVPPVDDVAPTPAAPAIPRDGMRRAVGRSIRGAISSVRRVVANSDNPHAPQLEQGHLLWTPGEGERDLGDRLFQLVRARVFPDPPAD